MGLLDLENYVCGDLLNRMDLNGVVIPITVPGQLPKPWFRNALPRAFDRLQTPWNRMDNPDVQISDGMWRGLEITTKGNDPQYGPDNQDGIDYPVGYRMMRYVYLVNPATGHVYHRPLRSVSEEQRNTQFAESSGWGWSGWWDWGWDDWCNEGCGDCGRVRWLDANGKFFLTHTPKSAPLTLRMKFFGTIQAPAPTDYTNNADNWFTLNLYGELALLCAAIMCRGMQEDAMAANFMAAAEKGVAEKWRLNQNAKNGSDSRVFVPERKGGYRASVSPTAGW